MPRRHQAAAALGIRLPIALTTDLRPWHTVVMSRLGRRPLMRRVELATLYRWTEQSVAAGEAPFSVIGTAAHPWVSRACELLNTTAVQLGLAGDRAAKQRATEWKSCGQAPQRVEASDPRLSRDVLAVMLADRLDVAWVRPQGSLYRLLRQRLAEDRSPTVRILIPVQGWGQAIASDAQRVVEELIAAGAVGYCCRWESEHEQPPASSPTEIGGPACMGDQAVSRSFGIDVDEPPAAIATALIEQPQRWLIHCTRGRQGAWPGQSEQQLRDWLLLSRPCAADLSQLATLKRIVGQRQLVGTARTVPGDQPVVCFSALPLLDMLERRSFRPHLGRWDAEPYGIAIDRDAARGLGAQEVIYAEPGEVVQIRPQQTWRLQARGRTFDWTAEREWRLPGVADLRALGPQDVVVFVDRHEEIAQLQGSPWPVISIQSLRLLARSSR